MYAFKKFRLQYEAEAYAIQITKSPQEDKAKLIEAFSKALSSDTYNLELTESEAKKIIIFMLREIYRHGVK